MTIIEVVERLNFWDTTFIVIIEGLAIDVELFISIMALAQEAP